MQLGKTRVAVYVEPNRLVVDGKIEDLADGKDLLLPTGVQVSRRGNLYAISSENGNNVRAVLNGAYIDTHVGLGHGAQQPRGLLGNPNRNINQLVTSNGVVLTEPVAFTDLYHGYAELLVVHRDNNDPCRHSRKAVLCQPPQSAGIRTCPRDLHGESHKKQNSPRRLHARHRRTE